MPVFHNPLTFKGGGGPVFSYGIEKSILFAGVGDSLQFTPPAAGDQGKYTVKGNLKGCDGGGNYNMFCLSATIDDDNYTRLYISPVLGGGGAVFVIRSGGAFESIILFPFDFYKYVQHGGWMFTVDTSQAVAASRTRFWWGNEEISPTIYNGDYPTLNRQTHIGSAIAHRIAQSNATNFSAGRLSEWAWMDGNPITDPTIFWEPSDKIPGLMVPIESPAVDFGDLGSFLEFKDALDLGKDTSGNDNHWTVTGSPVQTSDTPTNNHCTLNSLDHNTTGSLTDGNLTVAGGVATVTMRPSTGKWSYKADGVEQLYDAGVSGQFNPTLGAGSYEFGGYTPTSGYKLINAENMPANDYDLSGSYVGNGAAYYVYTGCALESVTIEGTTYDNDGTANGIVSFLANGFKLVSATENANGTSYDWTGSLKYPFKTSNAQRY